MPISKKTTDAEKAEDYARQAEKYLASADISAAHSLLAIYYHLRASGADQSSLAQALQRHSVAMEEHGPNLR